MCRRLIFLISFVAVLGMVSVASAATMTWLGGYDSNNWCEPANWDDDTPGSGDTALINWSSPERGPIIGIGCNADVSTIQGPDPNYGMTQVMDINTDGTVEVEGGWSWGTQGGTAGTAIINISSTSWITIGGNWRGTDDGISIVNIDGDPCIMVEGNYRGGDNSGWFYTNMNGGYLEIGGDFAIGDNGGGDVNTTGGTIVVRGNFDMGSDRGSAPITINMTGGLIVVEQQFFFPGSASRAGNIWLNLDGGVIDCNEFVHGGQGDDPSYTDDWRVDIEQGVLIIDGNVVDIIDANVAEGQITGYDGEGTVAVECVGCNPLDPNDGNTVVTALPPDPNTARDPNPGNGSTRVDPNVVLSWTAGVNATDHLVFFGTSFDDVDTMTDPCAIRPLVDCNYSPGPLEMGAIYYWRIDANNPTTTWGGRIWYFTVMTPIVDPNMLVHYKFDEPNGVIVTDYSGREYEGKLDGPRNLWDP
ncbi:MAG: hypothetical protein ACYS21_15275, partial [Planctomycetota bacterium]